MSDFNVPRSVFSDLGAKRRRPKSHALRSRRVVLVSLLALLVFRPAVAQTQLVQIHQDFSRDPGWDHYQNRIVGTHMPTVIQNFGWGRTQFTGGRPGEIGGRVDNSRHQAYYAMPLGAPLTFDDELSASGKLALRHIGLRGVGYFGFFNSKRHTWRVWSSMAIRVWEEDMLGQVMFDWMSSDWQARGVETSILLPDDGKVHTWSFHYEPEARADPTWYDQALERHITETTGNGAPYELQGEEHLFGRLKQEEPKLTRAALRKRLLKVRDQGLVEYFHRHQQHRWWKRPDAGKGHGRVTLQFDKGVPYKFWFDETIRQAPVEFDRFGLFNIKRFGERVEIYLGDLTVNGRKIDLTRDPKWEGRNNRMQSIEPNFQAMHDYGWSQTNWAGKQPGEIGGLTWRTEPQDPLFSYYGDDVGPLTFEDSISFSGSIYFLTGMTDAAAYFGYFNDEDQTKILPAGAADAGFPRANMMGIAISDSSAVGYYFSPVVSSAQRQGVSHRNTVFTPDGKRHRFSFQYDPDTNNGVGRIEVKLDDRTFVMDLNPELRKSGALFNRFGMANVRAGGHSVEYYLDDLVYTARRAPGTEPKFIEQTHVEKPYPHKQGGRRY